MSHNKLTTQQTDLKAKRPDRNEYTKEIADKIFGRLIEDESLRSICADPGMPELATVSDWITNNPEFRDEYALAREFQAHGILDEIIGLVDEVSIEPVEKVRANGRVVRAPDRSRLPRCRLRLEARQLVVDALLARARQLSTRTLFPFLASAEGESLERLVQPSQVAAAGAALRPLSGAQLGEPAGL